MNKSEIELIASADGLADSLHKLLTDLAKDGVAIEAYTDAWKRLSEYHTKRMQHEMDVLAARPQPFDFADDALYFRALRAHKEEQKRLLK